MIVAITDGRANISLKRSTDPEATDSDAPRPSSQELKVNNENQCTLSLSVLMHFADWLQTFITMR